MTKIKNAGSWVDPKLISVKDAGAWKPAKAMWCKYGGVWYKIYEGMPSNMIILYDTSISVPADATFISALSGRFAYGASAYGGVGGANTHAGSSHGNTSVTNTGSSTGGDRQGDEGTSDRYVNVPSGHYHTITHSHSDNPSNLPLYIDVVPTLGGSSIGANSVWPTTNTSMSALFSAYSAALSRYLRFASTYSIGGSSSHSHAYTGNSSARILGSGKVTVSYPGGVSSRLIATDTHYHSIAHTHTLTNSQSYVNLNVYKTTSSIALADLPSGVIAFFTSATLPSGWTRYTVADGRLIKCSNTSIGSTGGSATHSHASGTFTTGNNNAGSSTYSRGPNGPNPHTHTMNHGHLTAVNWMPPYTGIVIGIKN